MSDLREKFFTDFCNSLTGHFDASEIQTISSLFIIQLEKYEITNRCTEIAVQDTSSEQIIKMFLATLLTEGKSKNTVKAYAELYKRFLRDINKPLVEIKTMDIRGWLARRQQTVSLNTLHGNRAYLSSLFSFMETEGFIEKNPMAKIKSIKFDKGIKTIFSTTEIDMLRSACADLRDRAMLEVLLSSGIRVSELANMKIEDIDFKTKTVSVKAGKGNKSRKTYIDDVCVMHLKKYLKSRKDNEDTLLINRYGNPVSRRAIENAMNKIGARAEIDDIYPHKFRRTFATRLHRKGVDVATIQALMGHSNINTTMEYIVVDDTHTALIYNQHIA